MTLTLFSLQRSALQVHLDIKLKLRPRIKHGHTIYLPYYSGEKKIYVFAFTFFIIIILRIQPLSPPALARKRRKDLLEVGWGGVGAVSVALLLLLPSLLRRSCQVATSGARLAPSRWKEKNQRQRCSDKDTTFFFWRRLFFSSLFLLRNIWQPCPYAQRKGKGRSQKRFPSRMTSRRKEGERGRGRRESKEEGETQLRNE